MYLVKNQEGDFLKVRFQKIISFFVALALLVSLVAVPSYASSPASPDFLDVAAAGLSSAGYGFLLDSMASDVIFNCSTNLVSYDELEACRIYYNKNFSSFLARCRVYDWGQQLFDYLHGYDGKGILRYDENQGVVRIWDDGIGAWACNAFGNYPWCSLADYNSHVSPDMVIDNHISLPENNINEWIPFQDVNWSSYRVVTEQTLSDFVTRANAAGDSCTIATTTIGSQNTKIKYVYKAGGSYGKALCNYNGEPFVALVEPEKAAINNSFNYTEQNVYQGDVNGDIVYNDGGVVDIDNSNTELTANVDLSSSTTDNSIKKLIDLTGATLTLVNENGVKAEQYIESLTFNEDNRSYTVNTYDYTYNTTYNYYELNYYTYNIQYTYNNTYVTYIGSSAEYVPTVYELYYELPDGRSSADLTEEDIAGLSFQFADCINYTPIDTDTSLRALYHFDGDTRDSSYWGSQGSFTWNSGASITYMESNAFNGALYLDEREHDFTIRMPSGYCNEWTLQFRYYQNSADTTNHIDNWISVNGGSHNLSWSEQFLYHDYTHYDGDGVYVGHTDEYTQFDTRLSIGNWQELCIMVRDSDMYWFHNGVCIGTYEDYTSPSCPGYIMFHLGAESRAYSMIDELRFTSSALYPVTGYTPSSVPYDSNLALALPETQELVADEYYTWDRTITPWRSFDFTSSVDYSDRFSSDSFLSEDNQFAFRDDNAILSDGVLLLSGGSLPSPSSQVSIPLSSPSFSSSSSCVAYRVYSNSVSSSEFSGREYTFTLVSSNLTRFSVSSVWSGVPEPGGSLVYNSVSFPWGSLSVVCVRSSDSRYSGSADVILLIDLSPGYSFPVYYFEIVHGLSPNTGHVLHASVFNSLISSNTAAVFSDIPVHGYTVGGVRPTFPVRGDVWFPVEGRRISGVYIYNGQAWEQSDARYWTGTRWIPIYAFDLVTLADLWDIVGSEGESVSPAITSDYGFWNWWKTQWASFTTKLFSLLEGGSSSGVGGSSGNSGTSTSSQGYDFDNLYEDEDGSGEDDDGGSGGFSLLLFMRKVKSGLWKTANGVVSSVFGSFGDFIGDISRVPDFFTPYSNPADYGDMSYEGEFPPEPSPDTYGLFAINYGGGDLWG